MIDILKILEKKSINIDKVGVDTLIDTWMDWKKNLPNPLIEYSVSGSNGNREAIIYLKSHENEKSITKKYIIQLSFTALDYNILGEPRTKKWQKNSKNKRY